eukprot:CAMPEP_0167785980 /NCGR_PEP_ID=MMETSP0111_2-20121227/8526_1 /TAXON_ID=91324 /ORGANISM="Lotharella globosa, Strain CCCM811" /LENGTH=274 /DNA_ID=CAMNT_0007677287 /DNA_START=174 /DNA_END=998 /DNA_ORIENTATION=+
MTDKESTASEAKNINGVDHGKQVEMYDKDTGLKYLLYTPSAHPANGLLGEKNEKKGAKNWPLLVFLHGAGESGSGSAMGLVADGITGCPPVELHHKRAVPELHTNFVVASPRTARGWGDSDRLKTFTKNLLANKSLLIDSKRTYLTGVSMGGAGVWRGAPTGLFAALVPVCAAGMARPSEVSVPVWAFHGANDDVVPVGYTDRNIAALKKAKPELEIRYTRYEKSPGPIGYPGYDGHASWMQVYTGKDYTDGTTTYKGHHGPELFKWMLSKSLG